MKRDSYEWKETYPYEKRPMKQTASMSDMQYLREVALMCSMYVFVS